MAPPRRSGPCPRLSSKLPINGGARAAVPPARGAPEVLGAAPKSEALHDRIRKGLRDAWNAPTRDEARGRFRRVLEELRPDAPRLADWLADTYGETLACYALSREEVRRKLRSTNGLERHHQEIRRRSHVIRILPHEASLLRLLTALAIG